MTEERRERNRKNSERLTQIIQWSFQHKELWHAICYESDRGTGTTTMERIIDVCLHEGFMEIYYILLSRLSHAVEVGMERPHTFLKFLESSIDRDLTVEFDSIWRDVVPCRD